MNYAAFVNILAFVLTLWLMFSLILFARLGLEESWQLLRSAFNNFRDARAALRKQRRLT